MRKTNDEFIRELKQKHPHVYAIEDYINNDTEIKFKCTIDGNEWYARPRAILNINEPCPQCRNKNKRTTESFIAELKYINPNITVLGEYVNVHTKIKVKCNIDGYEWDAEPNALLNAKRGCPKCGGTLNLTHDEFLTRLCDINTNIRLISEYKNFKTLVTCECIIDGHIWDAYPQNLLRGHGCPICSANKTKERLTKTHDQFIEEVDSISPNIIIMSKYINGASKIDCKCKVCGKEWTTVAQYLIGGSGCPECKRIKLADLHRKDLDTFKKELYEINPYIEVIGEYINSNTNILCKCKKDGFEWYALPLNLLKGTGCPLCNLSHGERRISLYLEKNNIIFEPQYTFDNCRNDRKLPFDFYLPDFNLCIEYDGQQHYMPVNFGGCSDEVANRNFENTKKHDAIKDKFCEENNISLLRIPYFDFENIEIILNDKLS